MSFLYLNELEVQRVWSHPLEIARFSLHPDDFTGCYGTPVSDDHKLVPQVVNLFTFSLIATKPITGLSFIKRLSE